MLNEMKDADMMIIDGGGYSTSDSNSGGGGGAVGKVIEYVSNAIGGGILYDVVKTIATTPPKPAEPKPFIPPNVPKGWG